MKRWLCVGVLFFLIQPIAGNELPRHFRQKTDDPWFGLDKLKHLSSSFIMTTTGYYFQNRIIDRTRTGSMSGAGIITFSVGIGKEMIDKGKKSGFFSLRDIVANTAGMGLALIFIKGIE